MSKPKKHADAASSAPGDGWNYARPHPDVALELLERRWAAWNYVYPHPDVVLEVLERRWAAQREAAQREAEAGSEGELDSADEEDEEIEP